MKTQQYDEYTSSEPDSTDEQLAIIREMQAEIAALDPERVQSFAILIMEKPLVDEDPRNCYLTRTVAGTGPDKTILFHHFYEYMKAFRENCGLDEKADAPTQQ